MLRKDLEKIIGIVTKPIYILHSRVFYAYVILQEKCTFYLTRSILFNYTILIKGIEKWTLSVYIFRDYLILLDWNIEQIIFL
jgi:hypothetical protein